MEWRDKTERAKRAEQHSNEMQVKYGDIEIPGAVRRTKIYDTSITCDTDCINEDMEIIVEDLDTVSAGRKYCGQGKMALLNFASYNNPGGRFMNGSLAQEECLCHASCLYNVISQFVSDFYDWNNRHKNKSLYLNRALYSPDIIFRWEEELFPCDVITCAAPNKSAAQCYHNVSDEENTEALRARIKFVLDIAKENQVKTLLLGAYGCGVFGQDAAEVAGIFKGYLNTSHRCFEKVVFAIPGGRNLKEFEHVFCKSSLQRFDNCRMV